MISSLALSLTLLGSPSSAQTVQLPPASQGPAAAAFLPAVHADFSLGAEPMLDAYLSAQSRLDADLASIAALPAESRTFDNTIKALEQATARFDEKARPLAFLANVSPREDVRTAARLIEEDWTQHYAKMMSRRDLFAAVQAYVAKGEALSPVDQRLLELLQSGFQDAGLHLKDAERMRLLDMRKRLATLESAFQENIEADNDGLQLTGEELKGLPQDYVDRLERTEDGKYVVTLDYPDYHPFMQQAENGDARRRLELKFNNRAAKNTPLLEEALSLRDQSAKLLGHPTYAHMALDGNRTAGEPARVWEFLHEVWSGLRSKADAELADLLAVKRRDDPAASRIESWEKDYYSRKLKKERFDFDPEEVKQYLPMDQVVDGTMRVYERLLGVRFTEIPEPGAWHEDVKLFEIRDAGDGRRIGHFYLDLHPREGKYSHAAVMDVIKGRVLEDGSYREPVAAMVANFTPAGPDRPSLLEHDEVETFFHEFGHVMHETLTKAPYASISGFSVAEDFAEAPSQMLENFVWEREVLDLISGHWQDPSRKLPAELFEKMVAARGFNRGLTYARQTAFAMIDMLYHMAAPVNATVLFNQLMPIIGIVQFPAESHFEASFGHLMPEYAAGYYGYMWSERHSDDMFTRFKKEGLLDPAVGRAYRREILETGSARDEEESVKAFLGREPSSAAFMAKLGVK
jgi:thimet oligopeptidase